MIIFTHALSCSRSPHVSHSVLLFTKFGEDAELHTAKLPTHRMLCLTSSCFDSAVMQKEAVFCGGDGQMVQPSADCTGACCHGGAKMAVLACSLGKREINQYFTIKIAKLISLLVVLLLLVFHTVSRYYGGKWSLVY